MAALTIQFARQGQCIFRVMWVYILCSVVAFEMPLVIIKPLDQHQNITLKNCLWEQISITVWLWLIRESSVLIIAVFQTVWGIWNKTIRFMIAMLIFEIQMFTVIAELSNILLLFNRCHSNRLFEILILHCTNMNYWTVYEWYPCTANQWKDSLMKECMYSWLTLTLHVH